MGASGVKNSLAEARCIAVKVALASHSGVFLRSLGESSEALCGDGAGRLEEAKASS